jgi:hypothetical protein
LRFSRLIENVKTGNGKEIYGIWHSPQSLMKISCIMLDGSMIHIQPNNRLKTHFVDFDYNENSEGFINDITDEVILSRSSKIYTFSQLTTGYESFDNGGGKVITNQWDYEYDKLAIYSQVIIRDYRKLGIAPEPSKLPGEFIYFKDVLKIQRDELSVLPLDEGVEYINIFSIPYRFVMTGDRTGLSAYTREQGIDVINILAALALIHDKTEILEWLITEYKTLDLNNLLLLSCLYAKVDIFSTLENGGYNFNMDSFLADNGRFPHEYIPASGKISFDNGIMMINYAATSGNVPFFEMIYAKYFQKIMNKYSSSEVKLFKDNLWSWSDITGNNLMQKITLDIEKDKYGK